MRSRSCQPVNPFRSFFSISSNSPGRWTTTPLPARRGTGCFIEQVKPPQSHSLTYHRDAVWVDDATARQWWEAVHYCPFIIQHRKYMFVIHCTLEEGGRRMAPSSNPPPLCGLHCCHPVVNVEIMGKATGMLGLNQEIKHTWQRQTKSASVERMSTSFPLPSSPHCPPNTTITPGTAMPGETKACVSELWSRSVKVIKGGGDRNTGTGVSLSSGTNGSESHENKMAA